MVHKRLASLLLALPALWGAGPNQPNPFGIMETGRTYRTLAEAVAAVGDRSGTIIIAPGTYRQCAVQQAGAITYRAQKPGSVVFDGVTCEGKAALVLRGRAATVEAIIFQNMRVPDGNGAGIRLERGNLTVSASLFRTSEEGILTHDDPQSTIRIDHSIFGKLGRCDRDLDCAHGIYVGHYGHLIVTATRFEAGQGGHYLKSRAARVTITGNVFDDRAGRLTNYMIDLSNGASGLIANNIMVQGRDKDNYSAFITIAPEGREWDSNGLQIRDNQASFGGNYGRNSTFVANWTNDRPQIVGNRLTTGIKVTDRR
tara:strand:- start:644 stop:1582 length:939 start_codon:yes stop_codon:yes gene_type:complete